MNQYSALALSLFVAFVAAATGGAGSAGAGEFYEQMQLPAWAPPGWLFAPVWTILYFLMAIAAWLAWRAADWPQTRPALSLYLTQLLVNSLWSWLFFAWRLGGVAFTEILLLIVLLSGTVVLFYRLRPLAGLLMLPYLAWVCFAAVLNYSVWQLNPAML